MNIAGMYSFNSGKELIEVKYATELREVEQVIYHNTSTRQAQNHARIDL